MKLISLAVFSIFLATSALTALEISQEDFYFYGIPGEKIKKTITLKNDCGEAVSVHLYFNAGENKEKKQWLGFSKKRFKLKANQSRAIELTCKVPKRARES